MTTHAKATYVADSDFTLYLGDVRQVLAQLPAESVHCVVTSPPYWGLRDYGTGVWDGGDPDCDHVERIGGKQAAAGSNTLGRDASHPNRDTLPTTGHALIETRYRHECGKCGARRVDQQLGLEPTPDLYVQNMVSVFREVRRVLRRDGTCWINIGDSYAMGKPKGWAEDKLNDLGWEPHASKLRAPDLKPKDLVGIPWRLAFALQADGWYLRSDVIWSKPNPMPESVTDRPTKAHEYLFLLTRSPRYFYDADAIRETPISNYPVSNGGARHDHSDDLGRGQSQRHSPGSWSNVVHPAGRNRRSVWEIATEPYPDAHFATFPQALVEPCVLAGTSERGCCPVCGTPWERETERTDQGFADRTFRSPHRTDTPGMTNGQGATTLAKIVTRETLGWRPTCTCERSRHETVASPPINAQVSRLPGSESTHASPHMDRQTQVHAVPCVVLDPFMGSGTTALVARRLGRKSIGIELNEEYARLCAHRLRQLSLLA